jgi:hypothetical protein
LHQFIPLTKEPITEIFSKILRIGIAGKWHFLVFWYWGFQIKNPNEDQLAFYMRHPLFLHWMVSSEFWKRLHSNCITKAEQK